MRCLRGSEIARLHRVLHMYGAMPHLDRCLAGEGVSDAGHRVTVESDTVMSTIKSTT